MLDARALFNLSYGMYVISAKDGDNNRNVGCVANSVIQVSSKPPTLALSLNKNNYTTLCIQKSGGFAVSVMSETASGSIIGDFGFNSSRDKDKFAGADSIETASGLPVLNSGFCAYAEGKVINTIDCFTHIIFIAEIVEAKNLDGGCTPMTYSYYHKVAKGKTPKNAPTYSEAASGVEVMNPESAKKNYTCSVCGYVYPGSAEEFEALPDSYECPVCSVAKELFELK